MFSKKMLLMLSQGIFHVFLKLFVRRFSHLCWLPGVTVNKQLFRGVPEITLQTHHVYSTLKQIGSFQRGKHVVRL